MGSGIFFPISAIPFSIVIMVLFFKKERAKNIETLIYKFLLISNFIGLILELFCTYASIIYDTNRLLSDFIYKSYLVYLLTWTAFFAYYVYRISTTKLPQISSISKRIITVFCVLVCMIVYILPIEVIIKNDFQVRYTTGVSVSYTYIISGLFVLIMSIIILKNWKNIQKKKFIPIVVFFVIGTLAIIIQFFRPEILLITYVETLICVIMYFTIENPDLKMLNELYKNRELMEAIYEDKYNFLFEMTQEARNPIKDINLICSEIKKSNKLADVKENVDKLSSISRQLDFSINNVLNISSMDIQKIKIVNTKYDVLKLCDGIGIAIKDEVPESVKLNIELPKQVPTLYGDYMKLRQILYSLLNNACKKTANGSITLKLNTIEKYDICRLIFNISDTGPGMSLDVINDILGSTGELNKEELKDLENKECNIVVCKKIARLMGGNLMIKSTVGQGTDVVLTLDQRVYHDDDTVLNQYKNELSNSKRVLVVSQDKRLINSIKNRLSEKSVITSVLYYGGDAVDKIKSGKKFDFILVDDEMNEMSGFDTFKAIKEIDEKTPIIIMLKEDKERLKKHYLDDGFDNCLLISNLNSELNELVDKY